LGAGIGCGDCGIWVGPGVERGEYWTGGVTGPGAAPGSDANALPVKSLAGPLVGSDGIAKEPMATLP
jgi:hypothetical protein